jgi:hypothetical protein
MFMSILDICINIANIAAVLFVAYMFKSLFYEVLLEKISRIREVPFEDDE